ncbi:hypothetical protein NE237_001355 [Protea cynaroides]|uniref:S-protein homolog n=1 Tax=Protea cynaroides TaxID=273540 RepID=A0A9Q0KTC1_9MAGN|nr:hypothetical protein NE237_001355 [Protea cynaroides]
MMKMGKSSGRMMRTSCLVILFLMALTILFQSYEVQPYEVQSEPGLKHTVNVTNELGDHALTIHCKSKDDDLGSHTIWNQESYSWSFRENIFGRTLFFCYLEWKDTQIHSGTFVLFEAQRDGDRCPTVCNWSAKEDGLYGYNGDEGHEGLVFYAWS